MSTVNFIDDGTTAQLQLVPATRGQHADDVSATMAGGLLHIIDTAGRPEQTSSQGKADLPPVYPRNSRHNSSENSSRRASGDSTPGFHLSASTSNCNRLESASPSHPAGGSLGTTSSSMNGSSRAGHAPPLQRSRASSVATSQPVTDTQEALAARLMPLATSGNGASSTDSTPSHPVSRLSILQEKSLSNPRKYPLEGALAHGAREATILSGDKDNQPEAPYTDTNERGVCNMCRDILHCEEDIFAPCECAFRMCQICLEHVKKFEGNRCPGCGSELRDREQWVMQMSFLRDVDTPRTSRAFSQKSLQEGFPPLKRLKSIDAASRSSMGELQMVDSAGGGELLPISFSEYGYGSVAWQTPPGKSPERTIPKPDTKRRALFRTVGFGGGKVASYRISIFLRLVAIVGFLEWRVTTPTTEGYWLWLMSVICEIWFAVSWVLDTIPKLTPVQQETYKDRLKAVYDEGGEKLPQVDVFITTADAQKEPPLITACTILSVLAIDYPPDRLACYLSDDGASKLMFDVLAETAGFARLWVPFCKKYDIEPRNPEAYFTQKIDYLKDKVQPDFVKTRRKVKREYEEFKVRVNALVVESKHVPLEGWIMKDGTPWPGNNRRNHDGIIQVFLHPDGDVRDMEGNGLPPLVYVSREKRPSHDHNKKAGAMNALVRASALITNGSFILNLDCDHYVSNCQAIRDALCFFLDPVKGYNIGYIQFPQRFNGVDKNDRYANHNTVFFDINMKGLDGQQGPVYVGTGCIFRRKALYGYYPPAEPGQEYNETDEEEKRASCIQWLRCSCCTPRSKKKFRAEYLTPGARKAVDEEEADLMKAKSAPARLGMCVHFVHTAISGENALDDDNPLSPRSMLSDVILSISCDYEENTDWGKDIGWMYGSVTEDILTGMKLHTRGWRSCYCDPGRAAFKGSAPLNLTDRLHQVERWATGAVEIFFSAKNPLWAQWGTQLQLRQRIAYANNAIYPFTSIAIFTYCVLPPLALLTDYFFIPSLDRWATCWFAGVILGFIITSILELRWSNVTFEAWWRNEQFWVVAGISSHFAAVIQGILKVIAGLEIAFTLTSKGADDGEVDELHTFKFTWLLLPGCFIGLFNILGVVVGLGRAISSDGSNDWSRLLGKLAFSFWVLIHLYPFAKGLMGRRDKMPTIVLVWSILMTIAVSLIWTNFTGSSSFL